MLLFVCINQFMPLLPRTNGNVLFSSSSLCILSSACMKRIAIAINVVPWTQYTTQCLQTESFSKIYIFWEMVSNQSMKCRYTCNVYDNWKLILALALLYLCCNWLYTLYRMIPMCNKATLSSEVAHRPSSILLVLTVHVNLVWVIDRTTTCHSILPCKQKPDTIHTILEQIRTSCNVQWGE